MRAQGKQYTVDEGHIRFVGERFPGRRYNFKPTLTTDWIDENGRAISIGRGSRCRKYGARFIYIYNIILYVQRAHVIIAGTLVYYNVRK